MSDFNIFLTEEVKQQLRDQEEAEKRASQLGEFTPMNVPGNMPMTAHNIPSVNPMSPWGQGVTADNLLREAKAVGYDLIRQCLPDSLNRAWDEYNPVKQMPIPDTGKHAYISCVGAQGGVIPTIAMLGLGAGKEVIDIYNKFRSPEQVKAYGGRMGILKDSFKDLRNNSLGLAYGIENPEWGACDIFLK